MRFPRQAQQVRCWSSEASAGTRWRRRSLAHLLVIIQLQAIWMQANPGGVQMPQLALQQTWPLGQVTLPHVAGASGTQAQTCGDESKWKPSTQSCVSTQVQMPLQSA